MNKGIIKRSQSLYRLLLLCYPKRYRQQFGDEMSYVFSESLKDACHEKGEQGLIIFWIRTIFDAGKSIVIEQIENQKGGGTMKTKSTDLAIPSKNIVRILIATAGVLLIPFTAMQFTNEVKWSFLDFAIMGTLLIGTGLSYEILVRKFSQKNKLVIAAILGVILFLIWAELAVGIFGTPFAGS